MSKFELQIKYTYNRGVFCGMHVLRNKYSRHHIISYPMMRTFAEVAFRCEHYAWEKPDHVLQEKYVTLRRRFPGTNDEALKNIVSWAYANLFIGPNCNYRDDDPSQKMDKIPLSFPKERAEMARRIKKMWNEMTGSYLVGERNKTINIHIRTNSDTMIRFLNEFLDYVLMVRNEDNIYITCMSDWVVREVTQPTKCYYRFYFGTTDKFEKKENFAFYLREEGMVIHKDYISLVVFDNKKMQGIHKNGPNEESIRRDFDVWEQ